MEVKEVVKIAKAYVADVFSAENPSNIGLEEIVFDEMGKCWKITVGFSRPWDYQKSLELDSSLRVRNHQRSLSGSIKWLRLSDDDGKVKEVKIRA